MSSDLTHHISILSVKEIPNTLIVKLNSENIIEVEWNTSIEEIEKKHLEQLRSIIKEIGGSKKMPVYIDTYNFMSITPEARHYAASKESSDFTLANAVLVDILPKKLLFNFFLKINKPVVPTKGFSSKEEAFIWLKNESLNR